ncbi:hypothetical protein CO648_09460 [Rhizobium phaseoli]|uniref:Uncharacterized protein n=1 Tax=Rhizobium etli (strain CIAT 652) TaxID=491916 RepID=B3PVJ4_RHIE6|nr:hypothetical protein RHECIAT_CH0003266 [Rhizobium etli CIAT 652]PCD68074.1 hypothetical protein CO648_09460 [Rhizobium phaseoli]
MVDIVLSSRLFDVRSEHATYIAHDYLLNNLNFGMSAMHKNRFRLFIAQYMVDRFWMIAPCRIR